MAKSRRKKTCQTGNPFVFKGGLAATIGNIEAEEDSQFLHDCYVDAGHVSRALDTSDAGSILVGRTGAGKSAALIHVEQTQDNVIRIDPAALALQYISNSNVIRFFEEIPIDLDPFYQLLWRHAFTVELLNRRYKLESYSDLQGVLSRVSETVFHQRKKKECLKYLNDYKDDFFFNRGKGRWRSREI